MGLIDTIDAVVADFHAAPLPELTRRRTLVPRVPSKADAIVGMRRCGKTYLLYQVLHDLVEQGVPRERTLYVNLEDERLAPLGLQDLQLFPEALWRRFPASRGNECWFVFDEVQNVPGWERFVRRLIDGEHARVLVTGSSSRLLSTEIPRACAAAA